MSTFKVVSVIGNQVVAVSDGAENDEAHATLVITYTDFMTDFVADKVGDEWEIDIS